MIPLAITITVIITISGPATFYVSSFIYSSSYSCITIYVPLSIPNPITINTSRSVPSAITIHISRSVPSPITKAIHISRNIPGCAMRIALYHPMHEVCTRPNFSNTLAHPISF